MFKKIHRTIEIEGVHCEGCANRVKNTLSMISGVKSCMVSLEDKKVELVLTKEISDDVIKEKIESLGFSVVL